MNKVIIRSKKSILKVYYNCITNNPLKLKENISKTYYDILMDAVGQGIFIQYNSLENNLIFDNTVVKRLELGDRQ